MLHLSTLRNQSFNYLFQKYLLVKIKEQGCALRKHYFVAVAFHVCVFGCLNIMFLSWLQGHGLQGGTDPCVSYTQLTKLLNLIALLGIDDFILW